MLNKKRQLLIVPQFNESRDFIAVFYDRSRRCVDVTAWVSDGAMNKHASAQSKRGGLLKTYLDIAEDLLTLEDVDSVVNADYQPAVAVVDQLDT